MVITRLRYTKSAGGVVVNREGRIALVLPVGREKGWFFPKGIVGKGETVLAAAVREVLEEAGIEDLKLIRKLGNYQRHPIDEDGHDERSRKKTITMFLFSSQRRELVPRDASEISRARWVGKGRVAGLLFHPKDREFFLRIKGSL
jgi:8-oxo-dGTP pyrophosphatase MutT (NUDIX family)